MHRVAKITLAKINLLIFNNSFALEIKSATDAANPTPIPVLKPIIGKVKKTAS